MFQTDNQIYQIQKDVLNNLGSGLRENKMGFSDNDIK